MKGNFVEMILSPIRIDEVGGFYQSYYNNNLVKNGPQLGLEESSEVEGFRRPQKAQIEANVCVSDLGGFLGRKSDVVFKILIFCTPQNDKEKYQSLFLLLLSINCIMFVIPFPPRRVQYILCNTSKNGDIFFSFSPFLLVCVCNDIHTYYNYTAVQSETSRLLT